MKPNKMPQLYEGVILRETDRTDIMSNISNLGASYKKGFDAASKKDGNRELDKEMESLIKSIIKNDTRTTMVDLSFLKKIDDVKKLQNNLDKAQKNIRDQQETFMKGIQTTKSVTDLGGRIFLVKMQKESMNGNGSVLTTSAAKLRYANTFEQQSDSLLAVVMGYSSGSTWANKAIDAIKAADKQYTQRLTGGKATGKPTQEAVEQREDIETSIRAFTSITGELFDRIQAVRDKAEQRGKMLKF